MTNTMCFVGYIVILVRYIKNIETHICLYLGSYSIKSRSLRWTGHIARMEEGRSAFKLLTGKPIEKRPSGGLRRRW